MSTHANHLAILRAIAEAVNEGGDIAKAARTAVEELPEDAYKLTIARLAEGGYIEALVQRTGSNSVDVAMPTDITMTGLFALEREGASQGDDLRKSEQSTEPPDQVFIVHGTDPSNLRHVVARLVHQWTGIEADILEEKPNLGRTLIEKFEDHVTASCVAVVIATRDDVGCRKEEAPDGLRPRARQNVILELGFFVGRLARNRVIVLREEGLEDPSDFAGVAYIPLESDWRGRLEVELREMGFRVQVARP